MRALYTSASFSPDASHASERCIDGGLRLYVFGALRVRTARCLASAGAALVSGFADSSGFVLASGFARFLRSRAAPQAWHSPSALRSAGSAEGFTAASGFADSLSFGVDVGTCGHGRLDSLGETSAPKVR